MAERKVLNKYIPHNFDPNNASTIKRGRVRQKKVRLMAPFSMQCNSCGEFIYKGKKFNAQKERSWGEDYLGFQIFRFYIRCPLCACEITFKTDPENRDYTCEHGATRNYEPWRDETRAHMEIKADRERIEEDNPMLALENRTADSKREMDILDALDEIKTKNSQLEKVDPDIILEKLYGGELIEQQLESIQETQDEELVKSLFSDSNGEFIKRISDSSQFQYQPNLSSNLSSSKVSSKSSSKVSSKASNHQMIDQAAADMRSEHTQGKGKGKEAEFKAPQIRNLLNLDLGIKMKKACNQIVDDKPVQAPPKCLVAGYDSDSD